MHVLDYLDLHYAEHERLIVKVRRSRQAEARVTGDIDLDTRRIRLRGLR